MKKIIMIVGIIITIILGILIIINYFYTKNYDFKLNGADTIFLNIGDTWNDPLYTVKNNHGVVIGNNINYNKEGKYQVTYTLRIGLIAKTLTREIIIVNSNENTGFTLTLTGDNPYYLLNNQEYQELGYEANDSVDGTITTKVQITNNIDNHTNGTYDIKYQVKNSNGIIKTVLRKVIVYTLKYEGKLKTNDYTKNDDILLNINDANYKHTILPNGKITEEREIVYNVTENNTYSFKIYDKNNAYATYSIDVKNIDNTPPTGTCTFTLYDENGIIKVNASDNAKIKGYEYTYGSNKTTLLENANYTVNTLDTKANVTIYDLANNKSDISCNTIDKSTTTKMSYSIQKFNNREYWLYVPNKTTTRSKVPLVIYLHGAGGVKDINAVNNYALPQNIKSGNDFPYYVVAPHFASYNLSETNSYIIKLIDELVNKHNIDPERIVISGGSNGSDPAYYIAANNKIFSAMVIIAGHSSISDLTKLTYLGVWFHQGAQDNYKNIANYVTKLNSMGGRAKITKYEGGHTAPNNAFLNKNLTEWILNQRKK